MLSLSAQIKKKEILSDVEGLKKRLNGYLSDKFLNKCLELEINPFNADGSLKTKNTLSVMIWSRKHKKQLTVNKPMEVQNG